MKFEHFEGVSPADQFDRLGKKEDLNLPLKKLTEKLPENLSEDKNEKIEEVKAKIAGLKETLRVRGEEEENLPLGFLQEKAWELKEAEAELKALEAKGQNPDKKNLEDVNLQASLN
jgi:hypothetical protein